MNIFWIASLMIKRTMAKRGSAILFLVIPVLAVSLLIGLLDKAAIRVEAVNYDQGFLGRHLVSEMSRKYNVKVIEGRSEAAAKERVIAQSAEAAVVIPEQFSQMLLDGQIPEVTMLQLRKNVVTATLRQQLADETRNMASAVPMLRERYPSEPALEQKLKELFSIEENRLVAVNISGIKKSALPAANTSIGVLLLFVMTLANKSIVVMMEDRSRKTMMRVFSAPVRKVEMAAGYFLGGFSLGTCQVLLILGVTRFGMGFDYGVNFLPQFLLLECFLIASIGISSAAAGFARGSQELGLLNNLVMTPSCMIGGCFWPVEIMPDFMQKLSNFVPQKWVLDAMSQLASGSRLGDVSMNIGILLLFAVILLSFGSAVLNPEERETG